MADQPAHSHSLISAFVVRYLHVSMGIGAGIPCGLDSQNTVTALRNLTDDFGTVAGLQMHQQEIMSTFEGTSRGYLTQNLSHK